MSAFNFKRHKELIDQIPVTLRRLASAGLSRVWQQMLSGGRFGMVSAYKDADKLTPDGQARNVKSDQAMRNLLRHFDVGFVRMSGMFKDQTLQRFLPEDSLFIANISEPDLKALADLFGQEGYIYGENGQFVAKSTNGQDIWLQGDVSDYVRQLSTEEEAAMQVNPAASSNVGYSSLKGRPWMLDKQRGKDLEIAREKIRQVQKDFPADSVPAVVAFVLSDDMTARMKKVAGGLYLSGKKDGYAYCCFDRPIKQVSSIDFIHLDDKADVPPGNSLSIFLPLTEAG